MTIRPEKTVWDKTWENQSEIVKISAADRKYFKYIINDVNPRDKEVLELGCGRAALSYLLSEYGPKSITLVDFSKEALLRAKNIFKNSMNIKYIDKVLIKLKLYTFLNFLLTPFENMFGGVLIIIAQRK